MFVERLEMERIIFISVMNYETELKGLDDKLSFRTGGVVYEVAYKYSIESIDLLNRHYIE